MFSVIIPAHNEEKVIGRTLEHLLTGKFTDEVEVIVVCNGCSDKTTKIVKSFQGSAKCIETPIPSKTSALNLGDAAAKGFPRIYQDADVILSLDAVHKISKILLAGPYLAASPKMEINYQNSSWPVRSYYEIWQRLPYVKEGMIGTGVFALSEVGRKRFEKFPEIIADDGYIRSLFKSHERISVNNCYSIVQAPSTLDGLLKIKTRSRLGRYELAKKFSHLLQNEEKKYGPALSTLIMDVRLWAKISVYLYVNVITRYRALKYYKEKGYTGWERDNSSRKARV